jgi:hypothetical protein
MSALVELTIVIVGILLAISIDAWRQGVVDRQAEVALLTALDGEFLTNEELLAVQFERYEQRSAAAEALLHIGADVGRVPTDSLVSLWRWVTRGGTFDPSTGVLAGALGSGDISLIRDPELRAAIAAWPSDVENLAFVEGVVNNLIFEQLLPWLRTQTALPPASFGEFNFPRGRHETDFGLLGSSVIAENFLREQIGWGEVLEYDRVQVVRTLSLIRRGIDRSLTDS